MKKNIRIQNPKSIDSDSLLSQITDENEVTIQFSEIVIDLKLLQQIDEICKVAGKNFCVRFYGHYQTGFDCDILSNLPNVKSLYLDCLREVSNFSMLRSLECLEKLNVGIYELDEKDFLSWENLKKISYLCLVDNRKNNIDLKYLDGCQEVEKLFLNGHTKNIDAIGSMSKVTDLSLCVPKKAPISFVNRLSMLRKLRLILGGRDNFDEVQNYAIEDIEIIRVRGFQSFGNLTEFKRLRRLLIEDQIQISALKIEKELPNLNDIKILNCKTLSILDGIHNLPALHQLRIYKTAIEFSEFMKQKFPNSLQILAFYTTKAKADREIRKSLDDLGYVEKVN